MASSKHPQQKNPKKQLPAKTDSKANQKRQKLQEEEDEKFSPGEPDNYNPEEFSTD